MEDCRKIRVPFYTDLLKNYEVYENSASRVLPCFCIVDCRLCRKVGEWTDYLRVKNFTPAPLSEHYYISVPE